MNGHDQDVIDWLSNPQDQAEYQAWLDKVEAGKFVPEQLKEQNED